MVVLYDGVTYPEIGENVKSGDVGILFSQFLYSLAGAFWLKQRVERGPLGGLGESCMSTATKRFNGEV